jgi:hypothetical protein
MKARTFIITASVALALVVPTAANAATGRAPVELRTAPSLGAAKTAEVNKKQAAKIKALLAKNNRLAAQNRLLAAKSKSLASRISQLEARLIDINGPSIVHGASQPIDPTEEECRDYGTSCTDAQSCTFWGNNCHLAPPVDNTSSNASSDAAPAEETQLSNETTNSSENADSQSEPDFIEPSCDPQYEYC